MAEKLTGQQAKQGDRSSSLVKALLAGLAAALLVWVGVEIYGAVLKDDTTQLEQLTEEQPSRSDDMTTGSVNRTDSVKTQSN